MTSFTISIGRPQIFAGVLLLVLTGQSLWLVSRRPISEHERSFAETGRSPLAASALNRDGTPVGVNVNTFDSIIVYRIASAMRWLNRRLGGEQIYSPYAPNGSEPWIYRLPFVGFGVWLGGGLWWVARRIFGNIGGYIALALYCFSPYVVDFSSKVNPEIVTMWGFFGIVYTAIGVAHTLYAPPPKWRARMVLLGIALGLTASAHLLAALAAVVVATALMLYAAAERRPAVLVIIGTSGTIAALIFIAVHAFSLADSWAVITRSKALRFQFSLSAFHALAERPQNLVVSILVMISLAALIFWRHAQYFGNTVPLITAVLFPFLQSKWIFAYPWLWALPFVFVFVAGIWADLLETRYRLVVGTTIIVLLLTNAWLCLSAVAKFGTTAAL